MVQHGMAFVLAVLMWWASTGAIMMLCALPRQTFGWSMAGATLALAAAIYGLVHSATDTGAGAVYIAFLSAIGVWGWIEMTFLMGYVTGPRTTPCPAEAIGWRRFQLALQTVLYHELAIVAAGIAVVALTWKAPNQTGTFAFLILMAMRISAKLNIFLGVPNLTDELLPERLSYLKSYFRKCEVNSLFPVSVGLSSLVAILLAQRAFAADGARAIGLALLFTLLALAILEHFFMIMPLPDVVLWRWALPMPKQIDKRLP
jgi:putative photosynthetic complex assembly protein 2